MSISIWEKCMNMARGPVVVNNDIDNELNTPGHDVGCDCGNDAIVGVYCVDCYLNVAIEGEDYEIHQETGVICTSTGQMIGKCPF